MYSLTRLPHLSLAVIIVLTKVGNSSGGGLNCFNSVRTVSMVLCSNVYSMYSVV